MRAYVCFDPAQYLRDNHIPVILQKKCGILEISKTPISLQISLVLNKKVEIHCPHLFSFILSLNFSPHSTVYFPISRATTPHFPKQNSTTAASGLTHPSQGQTASTMCPDPRYCRICEQFNTWLGSHLHWPLHPRRLVTHTNTTRWQQRWACMRKARIRWMNFLQTPQIHTLCVNLSRLETWTGCSVRYNNMECFLI